MNDNNTTNKLIIKCTSKKLFMNFFYFSDRECEVHE